MAVKTVKASINGQEYTLTYDESSGSYKATITAPSKSSYNNNDGHYYPVSVTATDDAGNSTTVTDTDATFGDDLKLKVKEKVKPTIAVTYPTDSATITSATPTITWTVTDDDSGIDEATIAIKIDSGTYVTSGITTTATTKGFNCSYKVPTSLSKGSHSFSLKVSDHDGNAATEVVTSFTVDTVPPALTITSPVDGLITNEESLTVSGTTNDVTSTPVIVTVNGTPVTVQTNGSFSTTITLKSGSNTITVVATDAAGLKTTITRTVTLDTGAPVFQEITIVPNPVDAGKTYVISVKVTD